MVWFHPQCNNLNFTDFQNFSGSDDPWFCLKFNSDILPFRKLKNQSFHSFLLSFTEASSNLNHNKENRTLSLKPPPNFSLLLKHFNMTCHQYQTELTLQMLSITKIMALIKYKKIKLVLVLSLCFILTPVFLIRTLLTLNI